MVKCIKLRCNFRCVFTIDSSFLSWKYFKYSTIRLAVKWKSQFLCSRTSWHVFVLCKNHYRCLLKEQYKHRQDVGYHCINHNKFHTFTKIYLYKKQQKKITSDIEVIRKENAVAIAIIGVRNTIYRYSASPTECLITIADRFECARTSTPG